MKTATKNYCVLLQTGANTFQINTYAANSRQSLYPLYRSEGLAVEVRESTPENEMQLQQLGERLKVGTY